MNDAKLSDFSIDELQIAIGLFEDNLGVIVDKLQKVNTFFPAGPLRDELELEYNKQFIIVQLWKVQLENALGIVAQRERITNN